MKRWTIAGALALLLISASPALAWDPFREAPLPPAPTREPDPAPFVAPPPGIYYVTDTYVADVVTSSGPLTTYSTATVHESTGSYARVLDNVSTGASSAFDGSAFNGRLRLGDGRSVAGTYYENYALVGGAFVPVSVVFFQDDAELARVLATATSSPRGVPTPQPSAPLTPPSPALATGRPAVASCCQPSRPVTAAAPTPPPARPIRPGISLLPAGTPISNLEVLRGRAVGLWPRAFVDGREVPVLSWTVVSGDAGDAVALAGSGGIPFQTSWDRLAPPGAAYELVFRIEVDTPETGHRTADAAIAVIVRSPALEN